MPESPYIPSSDGSVREGETPPPDGLPSLGLGGPELTSIRIDHATRLQLAAAEIVIETPSKLSVAGDHPTLDPDARASLGPLLAGYPGTLVDAEKTT